MLDKLQKRMCRTVGPSLTVSLEHLTHRQNVASLSLFYRYYFVRCSSELAKLVSYPHSLGRSTVILIRCMIFLSSILDVVRMSVSTGSFLTQLESGNFGLYNSFLSRMTCVWSEIWNKYLEIKLNFMRKIPSFCSNIDSLAWFCINGKTTKTDV